MNRLVVIGWIGCRTAYLNIDRDEAIKKYLADHQESNLDGTPVEEIQFESEFGTYEVWSA